MIMLISKNYHLWIKKLQKLIEQHRIWKYVDSKETKSKLIIEDYSNFSDIVMTLNVTVTTRSNVSADQRIRSVRSINELTSEQQKNLQQKQFIWSMREKLMRRAKRNIQIVHQTVKTSARQYISSSEMKSNIRQILQTLVDRYKQSDVKIVELLHDQYYVLKSFFVKTKIEQWISEWENLKIEMINQELRDTFDNDVIFVHEFLRASKRWAFVFCEIWIIQHQTIERFLNFFKITRAYRNAYENFLRNDKVKDMIDAITLQSVDQDQVDLHICTKNDKDEDKHKDKFCICDQIHLFSQCSYIVSVNKTSEWKENFKMKNETRQKIQTKSFMIYSIKRIVDINILNELISSSKRKMKNEKKNENDDDDHHFNYANSAFVNSTLMITNHSLMNSVIYDSNCSQSFIFDKTRFLNDLISSNNQIKTSDEHMQIEEYETMLIWEQLKDKKIEMTFKKTTYILICFVILVFQSKLEKEEFDSDSFIKTLIHLKTNKQICEIQERFEVQLLEYNLISRNDQRMTNSVQFSKNIMIKAISWQWHQRLEHCRSQMIDHLSKEWIISDDAASKTIKCETCAVFKTHKLVQKQSSARTIKLYEMFHFDLIIYEIREFDEIICIAHFTNEFTHYSWVFSLNNHREKTLMLVFNDLINRCDRSDIAIDSMIRIIRTNQETSINKRLEDWIINQRIIWDWSAKNILEQNDISKRYEALLIEKARCIREHAKLSENLFSECYLTAEHLMNRTLNQALNWKSSLIRMQKLINQSIRFEIDHLKMYECKAYCKSPNTIVVSSL